MLGRANTHVPQTHRLYFQGEPIAEFTSFQEMRIIVHGKTINQFKGYQAPEIANASRFGAAQLQAELSVGYQQIDPPTFTSPTAQRSLLSEAEQEESRAAAPYYLRSPKASSPSAKITTQTNSIHEGNTESPKKAIVKNKNSNDAEGNFVLYEIKDGNTILKIGKANADDVMADGTIRRVHTSLRLAKKAGYTNAKATVIKNLGRTTTEKAKDAEATKVKEERANGNSLPLNKEKDKKYHN